MRTPSIACHCCAGRDEGNWVDLCDPCLSAWLSGRHPHGCRRDIGEGT